jgi:tachykinin receptor 3
MSLQILNIYRFNIVFFVLTYLLPMVMMGGCYARMGKHLWGTPIIGEETPQLLKNYQNKKKV